MYKRQGGDRRWWAAVGTVAGGPRWGPSLVGRGRDRRWWATAGTVAGRSTVVDERIGARVAVCHTVPQHAKHLVDGAARRLKPEVGGERLEVKRQPRDAEHDDHHHDQLQRPGVSVSTGSTGSL